jgi:hypothetical protein
MQIRPWSAESDAHPDCGKDHKPDDAGQSDSGHRPLTPSVARDLAVLTRVADEVDLRASRDPRTILP